MTASKRHVITHTSSETLFAQYPYLRVLYDAARNLPENAVVVELGCHAGKATQTIANALNKGGQIVYGVDTFLGSVSEREDFDEIERIFLGHTGKGVKENFLEVVERSRGKVVAVQNEFMDALADFADNSIGSTASPACGCRCRNSWARTPWKSPS